MKAGIVGLGKMGANMARRLKRDDHEVVTFDVSEEKVDELEKEGIPGTRSLDDLVQELEPPRIVWMMVPSGDTVDKVIQDLLPLLEKDDILVDGGNSNYKDTLRRADQVKEHHIHYVDVGTSGGVWGLEQGYSMMVGGADDIVEHIRPLLETLAPGPDKGWGHVGPVGAGHFVKMIHNGIEYGVMEAYAEGFAILKHKEMYDLDLHQIAEIWRFGSVIRSWLLDLTAKSLEDGQELEKIAPYVEDSGEGRWTVADAIDIDVPAPVITLALMERLRSRERDAYADKLLAAMRNQFGGHAVKKEA